MTFPALEKEIGIALREKLESIDNFLCSRNEEEGIEWKVSLHLSSGWLKFSEVLLCTRSQDSWILSPGEQPSSHGVVYTVLQLGLEK